MEPAVTKRKVYFLRSRNSGGSSSSSTTDSGSFPHCNDFVLVNILSRLPVKSIVRFKCVSKHWRYLIKQDRCLINLHEAHRYKGITSFLVYPTLPPPHSPLMRRSKEQRGRLEIRSIFFCEEVLRFDNDNKDEASLHSDTVEVTLCRSNIVSFDVGFIMLAPVHGLVCLVNCDERGSFLIYNPCTGDKTPWIKTTTSEIFISNFGQQRVADSDGRLRLGNTYKFGFGYDPSTKQHKVLCAYVISILRTVTRRDGRIVFVVDSRKVMWGVFALSENKWRNIVDHLLLSNTQFDRKCVYVNGTICWIHYNVHSKDSEVIVFDMGRETFRKIAIPDCIPRDLYGFFTTGKLVNKLVEADGHLAVLVQKGDGLLDLWIYNDNDGNAGGNWINETIQMPCRWNELHNLDFKPIIGTDLVVIKFIRSSQKQRECLRYYNRTEKKYYSNRFESLLDLTGHPYVAATYQITPFCETLLPVPIVQQDEAIN